MVKGWTTSLPVWMAIELGALAACALLTGALPPPEYQTAQPPCPPTCEPTAYESKLSDHPPSGAPSGTRRVTRWVFTGAVLDPLPTGPAMADMLTAPRAAAAINIVVLMI